VTCDREAAQGVLAQDLALSIQCVCSGLVALGAVDASYRHGREFALRFGADGVTADARRGDQDLGGPGTTAVRRRPGVHDRPGESRRGRFLVHPRRADDALNWGGFKIVPSVLEEALRIHPAVGEASVVGIPDERLGEVPVAAATLRAEWGVAELQDWLADRPARYQVPAVVKIVNELPRTRR